MHTCVRGLELEVRTDLCRCSFQKNLLSLPIQVSHASQMPHEVSLADEFREHNLRWCRSMKSRNRASGGEGSHKRMRYHDVSEANCREKHLAESSDVNHSSIVIDSL